MLIEPFIHSADLHLREDVPRCRDQAERDWWETQAKALRVLMTTGHNLGNCDIILTGDIFHRPRTSFEFLNFILEVMGVYEGRWVIMMGNHDMDKRDPNPAKTSYGVLENLAKSGSPHFKLLREEYAENPYGTDDVLHEFDSDIIGVHEFLQEPGNGNEFVKDGVSPRRLMAKFPDYQFILVGDHHKHFSYELDGRWVLNPGCITVQDVTHKDAFLGFFAVIPTPDYEFPVTVKSFPFPADPTGIIDDAYIEREHAREERMEVFAEKMASVETSAEGGTLDFEARVREGLQQVSLGDLTVKKIHQYMAVGAK